MTEDLERMARLRTFGLSEYAGRAYLALLALGTTEARDVSRRAKIPLAKVYGVLEQLQARGLATIEPTAPKRFSPVPFGDFLAKVRERRLQEVRELEDTAQELTEMFSPIRQGVHYGDRGSVRVLKGRVETLQTQRTLLAKAQEDVLIATALGWTLRNVHTRGILSDARARGVQVRLLVHATDQSLPRLHEFSAIAEMRERSFTLQGAEEMEIAIFDGQTALLTHYVPDDASTHRGDDVAILVEEAGIVRGIECHLEARWEVAPPLVMPGSRRR